MFAAGAERKYWHGSLLAVIGGDSENVARREFRSLRPIRDLLTGERRQQLCPHLVRSATTRTPQFLVRCAWNQCHRGFCRK
jgi:hypothetical protein